MRGWVYVMGHDALPGYVRMGHAMTDPAGLVAEFDQWPFPGRFRLLHDALCADPEQVAAAAAAQLADCAERDGWFRCPPTRVIGVLRSQLEGVSSTLVVPVSRRAATHSPPRQPERVVATASRQASGARPVAVVPPLPSPGVVATVAMADAGLVAQAVPAAVAASVAQPAANESGPAPQPRAVPITPPSVDSQFGQRREALLERYDLLLRRSMPDSHLWSYFFGLLTTFLVVMELFASFSPHSMFGLAALGALVGAPVIRLVLLKRHKQSPQYRQLLASRERELADLEREYERRQAFGARFRIQEPAS